MVAMTQRGTVKDAGNHFGMSRFQADTLLRFLEKQGLARQVGLRRSQPGRPAALWEWPALVTLGKESSGH